MIQITKLAKQKIIEMREDESFDATHYLRIGVTSGGCSGLMYNLSFDKERKKTDELFKIDSITLLINKQSLLYLAGTILDFSGGLNGKGLHFVNPKASRTCGCGESFAM